PISEWMQKQGCHQEISLDEEPNRKFLVIKTGRTLNSHEDFIKRLKKQIRLQEVSTVEECDFILGFCPVASRAGIDVERALETLQNISDTKLTVLVVLHHTFEPDFIVQDTNRAVNFYCRTNTIAVDCLFHEDVGLLQCPKNVESLFTTSTYVKSLHIQALLRDVKEKCGETERKLEKNQMELKNKDGQLDSVMKELETSKNKLIERDKQLQEKDRLLTEQSETLEQNATLLKQIQTGFGKTVKELEDSQRHMEEKNTQLENMNKLLSEKETQLKNTDKELETSNNKLETLGQELQDKNRHLQEMMIVLEQQKTELAEKIKQVKKRLLTDRETQLMERDKELQKQADPESSAVIRRRKSKELLPPK
ncbi:calponin homology domain-containing protein DDB_G0272472-like isoform X3, partial [Clarias magur]